MKSDDFQVGGAMQDDSTVSIMSMGYEGCCLQETQRQGHGVVNYGYDYGDATSAKLTITLTGVRAWQRWNVRGHWAASRAIAWWLNCDGSYLLLLIRLTDGGKVRCPQISDIWLAC